MGRIIQKIATGTKECFEAYQLQLEDIHKIPNSEVYYNKYDNLYVVVPPEWAEYLTGKREDIPVDDGCIRW